MASFLAFEKEHNTLNALQTDKKVAFQTKKEVQGNMKSWNYTIPGFSTDKQSSLGKYALVAILYL